MSREDIIKYASAAAVLLIGYLISRWISALVRKRSRKVVKNTHYRNVLSIGAQIIIMVLVVVYVLDLLDLGTAAASLAAGAGIVGIIIGYGSQRLFQEATAAAIIFLQHHFEVGDWIKVGKNIGRVTNIGFRGVSMVTALNESLFVPATSVISKPVINFTRKTLSSGTKSPWRTIRCSIYADRIDGLRKYVNETIAKEKGVEAVDVVIAEVVQRKSFQIAKVDVTYKALFDETLHYRLIDLINTYCAKPPQQSKNK